MAQCTRKSTSIASINLLFASLLGFPIHSLAAERFETPVGFNVSPTGAANSSIPIEVPPGTAGMVPNLSLNYSSQGGDGLMGLGWSLGGLSTIYRCGRTLTQDGVKDTVNYNANDRYCMDGQRLVPVTATSAPPAGCSPSTEYRTERESFTKVVSCGAAGSGPRWFKAWTKSGQIIEFGNTADSRIEVAPWENTGATRADVRVWAINKVMDAVGNYFAVTYTEDNVNGDYRPNRIDYTGNPNSSPVLTPYNSVRFVYQTRPDITPAYQAGSVIKTMMRLANVQTYAKVGTTDTLVKDYRLAYDISTATQRSRVTAVTECAGGGGCLPATNFGWDTSNKGFQLPSYNTPALNNLYDGVHYNRYSTGSEYRYIADFNGDGRADYMWMPHLGDGRILIAYGTDTGFTLPDYNNPALHNLYDGVHYNRYSTGSQYQYVADFNGDGKADYMWMPHLGDGRWLIAYGTATGFILPNYNTPAMQNLYDGVHYNRSSDSGYQYVADFNGDGKADFMWMPHQGDSRIIIAYSNGNGFTLPDYNAPALHNLYDGVHYNRYSTGSQYQYVADFNGDGKADYMWMPHLGDSRIVIAYSNGNGFTLPDYNAPALHNLYDGVHYNRSGDSGYQYVADFNGDGKADYMWMPHQGDNRFLLASSASPNKQADALASLTTGLGSVTSLAYKPLTNNTVYTKGTGAVYPYIDLQAPMYVVSLATVPNGIGGTRTTNYKYTAAKSHLTGGGFLGFRQFDATDVSTGIKTSTIFRQDYPYHGLPTTTTQTQSNGNLLKKVTNTWGFTTYADTIVPITATPVPPDTRTKHHFPAILTSVEESYGLGGVSELLARATTDNSNFDAYGNVKTVKTTTNDNHVKTITNIYSNDAVKWILGRVTSATVTSTLPNGSSLTRTSAFSYDADGLLLTETIEPNNAALRLDTTYTYDAFGNKLTATVSGSDITTRSTRTAYDAEGRFPVSATNALNHTEIRVFDHTFGNVTKVTGPNGLVSNFAFDVWGRPTTESSPDGVVTTTTRGLCPSTNSAFVCPSAPPAYSAAYYVSVSKPGTPTRTAYFDKSNRELRASNTGFSGQLIYKDTEYDNKGRITRVSRPYYTGNTAYWTTYSYDLLNRAITETDPQGKISYFDYYGLTTITTNPLGQKRTTVKNPQGQLVSVTDALNSTITYTYDPFGNLLTTTDPAGNVTSLTYDLRGRKTGMNDPDMGVWSYTYNVLGELWTQTDAKGQVTTHTYDLLGRMVQRIEPDLTTTWTYDTATKGIGKLASTTTDNGQTRSFTYDLVGRLSTTSTTIGSTTLAVTTTYDTFGRIDTQTNPAGVEVQNVYNTYGHLSQIRNAQSGQVYWTANNLSADGQLTGGTFGNGVVEGRTIDTLGRTTAVTATHTLGTVTLLNYTYDALGNLKTRTDTAQNLTENFGYDALNRLISISSSNPNQSAKTISYDAIGNITNKSDTGAYTYAALRANGTNRPHAVSSVAGSWNTSFDYDANGNMISGGDRTYTYTSFNLPDTITRTITIEGVPTTKTTTLMYGADHERVKEIDDDGTVTLSLNPRLDSGAHYDQRIHPGGVVEKISFLYAAARPIGIYTTNAHGQVGLDTLHYIHVDAQGSIVALSEGIVTQSTTQIVVERMSYDAWGKRRNIDGTDDTTHNLRANNTDHGYTGHMHLDDVGLIHMNGRVYDPRLGRFLQADPYIQSPGDLQSYNRYAYVLNNPFLYTDPSGYLSLKKAIKIVVVVVVSYYTGGLVSSWAYSTMAGSAASAAVAAGATLTTAQVGGMFVASQVLGGAVAGFTSGLLSSGGDMNAAWRGARGGMIQGGFGAAAGLTSNVLASAILRGTGAGASSKAMGGEYNSAFQYAFGASMLRSVTDAISRSGSSMRDGEHYSATAEPNESGPVYKVKGGVDVIKAYGANTGQAIFDASKEGQPVPEGDFWGWKENNGIMLLAGKFPGIRAGSVFHDTWGLTGALNVATVPLGLMIEYHALGVNSYKKYLH